MGRLFDGDPVVPEQDEDVTISWLSLPANLGITVDELRGWDRLSFAEWNEEGSPPDHGILETETSSKQDQDKAPVEKRRLHIYGLVSEGDTPVYCFYDSNREHWFRLALGDVDAESGTHLYRDEVNAGVHLVDMESGERFRVNKENWDLTPIDESLPGI